VPQEQGRTPPLSRAAFGQGDPAGPPVDAPLSSDSSLPSSLPTDGPLVEPNVNRPRPSTTQGGTRQSTCPPSEVAVRFDQRQDRLSDVLGEMRPRAGEDRRNETQAGLGCIRDASRMHRTRSLRVLSGVLRSPSSGGVI